MSLSTPQVARFLQDMLGAKLVAFIAGVADSGAVGQWANGTRGTSRASLEWQHQQLAGRIQHELLLVMLAQSFLLAAVFAVTLALR